MLTVCRTFTDSQEPWNVERFVLITNEFMFTFISLNTDKVWKFINLNSSLNLTRALIIRMDNMRL